MRSRTFDEYLYTSKNNFKSLRWVMNRGIDVRNFRLEVSGNKQSDDILKWLLQGTLYKADIGLALYYIKRGNLGNLNEVSKKNSTVHIHANVPSTALSLACKDGHTEVVEALLAAGADKEFGNQHGTTPLTWAAKYGHLEVVRVLVAAGVDVNKTDKNRESPLMHSIWGKHLDIAKFLVLAGAKKDNVSKSGFTPLIYS